MGWFSDVVSSVSDAVNSVVDTGNSILAPVTSAVPNPFNILSNAVGDSLGGGVSNTLNTAGHIVDTAQNHPVEVLAVAGGYNYYSPADAGSLSASMAPVEDATVKYTADLVDPNALSGIDLGGAGASPASWTGSTVSQSAASQWTWGQVASTTTSGLNLAASGVKLASLGKTMNANTPTVDGLTGGLAASPIQTPAGLITTTPQGPVTAGPVAATGGFMGMDTQTLMVIAFAAGTIWYLTKHAKA